MSLHSTINLPCSSHHIGFSCIKAKVLFFINTFFLNKTDINKADLFGINSAKKGSSDSSDLSVCLSIYLSIYLLSSILLENSMV